MMYYVTTAFGSIKDNEISGGINMGIEALKCYICGRKEDEIKDGLSKMSSKQHVIHKRFGVDVSKDTKNIDESLETVFGLYEIILSKDFSLKDVPVCIICAKLISIICRTKDPWHINNN